jgi:hypothetical protein
MEAIMRNTRWALVAVTVAAIVASGGASAQSSIEQARTVQHEVLVNRLDQPHSETDFRLGDHQQLKGYFLRGAREPLR